MVSYTKLFVVVKRIAWPMFYRFVIWTCGFVEVIF